MKSEDEYQAEKILPQRFFLNRQEERRIIFNRDIHQGTHLPEPYGR